jgi:hypothetical protein
MVFAVKLQYMRRIVPIGAISSAPAGRHPGQGRPVSSQKKEKRDVDYG